MNLSPTESKDESDKDRITDLPDALIHHIFSFMDMSDVVRTSILSNRWKTLWLSTPTLNFFLHLCSNCEDLGKPKCDSCIKRKKGFMDFVDRVLILGKSSNLDKFNLSYMVAEVDTDRLHTWVLAAIGKNARNLLLEVYCSSQPIVLPYNLFKSNITVLKLSFYCNSPAILPNSICIAPKIKDLQLRSVMFPNGNASGELILSCPVLESLNISHCDLSNIKVFSVSTPQLENLEFVYLYTKADISCQVKTCTPNLKRIKIKLKAHSYLDNSMLDYCLENLTSLLSAEVGFYSAHNSKKSCSECLIKILTGIHNVQSLKLTKRSLQPLTDFPESLEKLSDMFGNLKFLTLKLESPSVHAALNFLDRFSHIENLVYERCPKVEKGWCLPLDGEKWVANLPFQRIFTCLKTFEIRNFQGFEVELKFLEFVLQRAVALEDMIIALEDMIVNTSEQCLLVEKLQSLSRASSSPSIWFKQSC